ncbi:MAG TPA: lysophospholipid acyltransferase family protein [Elusimicrobiota bacterium]|nr:lysophospholipid acyltransferase family protein [Elusimicrobiota bacterium]
MDARHRLGYFLEYLLVRIIHGTLSALPRPAGSVLGRVLGRLIGGLFPSRTRLAVSNMTQAFPDASPVQIRRWAAEGWESLGQAAWEFARFGASEKKYLEFVKLEGVEHIRTSYRKGKGAILFTAHYTNWELTSGMVALSGCPVGVIARRMKNPYVNDFLTRLRSRLQVRVFMHKQAVQESIRWLKKGNLLGVLFDQRITDGGVSVPFFGRPAHTTTLPALLALRLGCPLHPVHCWREDDRLRIHIGPPVDVSGLRPVEEDIRRLTERLNGVVEEWVRRRPPMWLWIHNRWK